MHVRYWSDIRWLEAKLLFYVVMVGLCCHCAVLFYLSIKGQRQTLVCPVADLTSLFIRLAGTEFNE